MFCTVSVTNNTARVSARYSAHHLMSAALYLSQATEHQVRAVNMRLSLLANMHTLYLSMMNSRSFPSGRAHAPTRNSSNKHGSLEGSLTDRARVLHAYPLLYALRVERVHAREIRRLRSLAYRFQAHTAHARLVHGITQRKRSQFVSHLIRIMQSREIIRHSRLDSAAPELLPEPRQDSDRQDAKQSQKKKCPERDHPKQHQQKRNSQCNHNELLEVSNPHQPPQDYQDGVARPQTNSVHVLFSLTSLKDVLRGIQNK